jgi:hypothetical protein
MDNEARHVVCYIVSSFQESKKGRCSSAGQSSGGGSGNVSNAGCYWLRVTRLHFAGSLAIMPNRWHDRGDDAAKDRHEPESEGKAAQQAGDV